MRHNGFGGGGVKGIYSDQHSLSEYPPFLVRNPAQSDRLFFPWGNSHNIQQHTPLESAVTNVALLVRFICIVVDQPIPLLLAGQPICVSRVGQSYIYYHHHCGRSREIFMRSHCSFSLARVTWLFHVSKVEC